MLRGLNHSQLKTVGPIRKRLQSDNKKKTFLVLDNFAMVFFPDVPENDFGNK